MAYDPNNPRGHYDFDVRVPESVIEQIRELGMAEAIKFAQSGTADPEFVEGVRRFYPMAFPEEASASTGEPDPLSGIPPEESVQARVEQKGADPALPPTDGSAPRPTSNPVIPLANQEQQAMNDPALDNILLSAPDAGQGMLPGEDGSAYLDHFRGEASMRPPVGPGGGAAAVPIPEDVNAAVQRRFAPFDDVPQNDVTSYRDENTVPPDEIASMADSILNAVPPAPTTNASEVMGTINNTGGGNNGQSGLFQNAGGGERTDESLWRRFNNWRTESADARRAAWNGR